MNIRYKYKCKYKYKLQISIPTYPKERDRKIEYYKYLLLKNKKNRLGNHRKNDKN